MKDITMLDEPSVPFVHKVPLEASIRDTMEHYGVTAADMIAAVRGVRDADQARIDEETQAALDELNAKRKAAGLPVRGVRTKKESTNAT